MSDNFNELKRAFDAERDSILKSFLSFKAECEEKGQSGGIPLYEHSNEEMIAASFSLIKLLDGYPMSTAKRILKDAAGYISSAHVVKAAEVSQVLKSLSSSLSH